MRHATGPDTLTDHITTGQRRPAMVMKYGHRRRPALRRLAQVERQLPRAGDQAADQQELPRAGGGGQRPVRRSGGLWSRSRTSGARTPRPATAWSARMTLPGREGDEEVARQDADVGQARPARSTARSLPLRPYTSSKAAQQHRQPRRGQASAACAIASSGLVGDRQVLRDPGRPAALQDPWPTGPACTRRSPPTPARTW